MICQNCRDGREQDCWGLTKDKTWCDSQHYPLDTVILQAQFCKHLRASDTYCPTCGSDLAQDRDGGGTTEQPMDFGYLSLPAEIQRDIEDNFRTDAVEEAREDVRKAKRSIIPRRSKETPSS